MEDFTPHLTFSNSTTTEREILSASKAARMLNLNPGSLAKLVSSGYLPTLYADDLRTLAARPYLESTTRPLYVIQTGAAQAVIDDVNLMAPRFHVSDEDQARAAISEALSKYPDEWRVATGDSPRLSDQMWVDAARGDWHNITPDPAVRYMLIVLATFVTGVLRIDTHEAPVSYTIGSQRKHRFPATLVGRLGTTPRSAHNAAVLTGEHMTRYGSDITPFEREFVDNVLGKRVYPRAGVQAFLVEATVPADSFLPIER
ncbi:hypothetical protein QVL82_10785 [Cellulosimicrobium funkei]|uniref:hypothetical protein n=1 Tax=Cellulosimicrobium funkei TaxID=264251 RepID=UPI003757F416